MITTVEGLRSGQLVRSIAGRDRHQYYLILKLINDRFVGVVDGVKHSVTKPKKKNLKHLKIYMLVAKEIETAILRDESVSNSQVGSALKRLENELEEGERFNG